MVGASFAAPAAAGRTAHTITAFGNAQVSTSTLKFGTGNLLLDGVGDYLTVTAQATGSAGEFGGSGNQTLEFWYYRPSNDGGYLFDFRDNASSTSWCVIDFGDGATTRLGLYQNGYLVFTNVAVPLTTWTHIALVKTGTSVQCFKNGTLTDTVTSGSSTWTNSASCFIGANYADTTASGAIAGRLDEIRFSNVARYNYNFPVVTDAFNNDAYTTLLMHCNGANASTSFTDDAATTRTAVVPVRTGNVITSTAQFKFGTASGYSDGTGDSLVAPAINLYGDWTIEGWFRPDSPYNTTADRLFFSFDPVYMMVTTGSNLMYIYIGGSAIGSTAITAGAWHHIAFQQTGSSLQGFVDGVYQTTRGWGGNGSTDIRIAGAASGTSYKGYFDEIRVSNICRYNTVGTTFTPPTAAFTNDSNTLLLLHLDGANNGTTFTDDNT